MKVKILATPKQPQRSQSDVNPFSNPYAEQTPDMMKYGGQKPGANGTGVLGNNRYLSTQWDWMNQANKKNMPPQPFSRIGHIIPEASPEDADIVVEKQEKLMGDFTGDGMPTLLNSATGSHASGNDKPVTVPAGTFVFSDTPSLKIKDPAILARFGEKKPKTPAQIATKYDLQKWKAMLDNKEIPEIEKNTAKLMYANCVAKLNELAGVQEQMKADKGIPPSSLPGQPQDQGEQVAISKYGGIPIARTGVPEGAIGSWSNQPWMREQGDDKPLTPDDPTMWGSGPETQRPLYNPNDPASIRAFQQMMTKQHPDIVKASMDQINPKTGKRYGVPRSGDYVDALDGPRTQYWQSQLNKPQDNRMTVEGGQSAFAPIAQTPWAATAQDANQQASQPGDDTIGEGHSERQYPYVPPKHHWYDKRYAGDPNFTGKLSNVLNQLTYPKTAVQRQVANPFYQQFAPGSNRAEVQEIQGQATALGANEGSDPIGRANTQGRQGVAANAINKSYANLYDRDLAESERIGAANSDMSFKTQGMNIQNLKDYVSDVNNAQKDQWAKLADFNKNNTALANSDYTRKMMFHNMNVSSPWYSYDSSGYLLPQTANQKAEMLRILGPSAGGMGSGEAEKVAKLEQYYAGVQDPKLKGRLIWEALRGPSTTRRMSASGVPGNQSVRGDQYEMETQGEFKFGGKSLKKPKNAKLRMRVLEVPQ
jgi:hypothetical protein